MFNTSLIDTYVMFFQQNIKGFVIDIYLLEFSFTV